MKNGSIAGDFYAKAGVGFVFAEVGALGAGGLEIAVFAVAPDDDAERPQVFDGVCHRMALLHASSMS